MTRRKDDINSTRSISELMGKWFVNCGRLDEKEFQCMSSFVNQCYLPFLIYCSGNCKVFETSGIVNQGIFNTQFFRLKNIDRDHFCVVLELLKPVDIEGCPIDYFDELYSLLTTDQCITVDLNSFCAFSLLSSKFVNRPIPVDPPKC